MTREEAVYLVEKWYPIRDLEYCPKEQKFERED